MGRKRFTAEQIINMLREAEMLLNQGSTVGEVCRKLVICGLNMLGLFGVIKAFFVACS